MSITARIHPGGARTAVAGAVLAIMALAPLACGGPSGTTTDGDPTGDDSTGGDTTGDPGVLVGSFQISLVAPVPASGDTPGTPGKTTVLGKVYDGPVPAQVVWEEADVAGDCRLLTPRIPLCSTPCGGTAVCVEDETCQDYPTAGSVGTVTVTGVQTGAGADSFTMDPVANTYQPAGSVALAYPAFAEGDEIRVEAEGDVFEAFSVSARGIAPLELTSQDIELAADAAVTLTWTPPAQPDLSRVEVKLDISHHGGTKGMIVCDAPDTGSLELAAGLVGDLLALGVAGFPSIIITREHVGSTTIAAGRVDVVVGSSVERFVRVEGVSSCTDDTQCGDGQTCQPDLTCA